MNKKEYFKEYNKKNRGKINEKNKKQELSQKKIFRK